MEILVKVGASLNAYNAFIYPCTGPTACGFWLSLTVFIDSYELTKEQCSCINTRLSFLNTGQQVAVFHSKLCPNLHTNHWSYLEVPSRALTKCTGCTCWVFQTCQYHWAYHSCERGHKLWPFKTVSDRMTSQCTRVCEYISWQVGQLSCFLMTSVDMQTSGL